MELNEAQRILESQARDAERWRMVMWQIGADFDGRKNVFCLRGVIPPEDVMRGGVAEHFVKVIDKMIEKEKNGF